MIGFSIDDLRRERACNFDTRVAQVREAVPCVGDFDPIPVSVWWGLPSTTALDMAWSLPLLGDVGEDMARALSGRCLAFVTDILTKSCIEQQPNIWDFQVDVRKALAYIRNNAQDRILKTFAKASFGVAEATLDRISRIHGLKEACTTDEEIAIADSLLQAATTAPFIARHGLNPRSSDSYECPYLWELLIAAVSAPLRAEAEEPTE